MKKNVYPLLPKLVVNGHFMQDFLQAELPCCGLGVVEVTGQKMGLVALRLNEVLPRKVADLGFRFGHCLLGTSRYEVIHFAFVFYGWKTSKKLCEKVSGAALG